MHSSLAYIKEKFFLISNVPQPSAIRAANWAPRRFCDGPLPRWMSPCWIVANGNQRLNYKKG